MLSGFIKYLKELNLPFLKNNGKLIFQILLTLLFIAVGIWFIKNERDELHDVSEVLVRASWHYIVAGICLTIVYIALQGMMYVKCFASVRCKVSFWSAVILFLKRNFISVFLPAGGVSSLAFFTGDIEKKGITRTQIHFASSVYAFVGILSVVIVAIPAFIFAMVQGSLGSGEWYALVAIILLKIISFFTFRSILRQGIVYRLVSKIAPVVEVFMDDLRNNKLDKRQFIITVNYSILIEIVGIAHLYMAMLALNVSPTIFAAIMGYVISVIFLIISPFLRGLGAIEVSMAYILMRYGYSNVEAISITFLYRFFEFWLPLFSGVLSFLAKVNKLMMRILPAVLIFILGIINIISVLTPAILDRLGSLLDFLPMETIRTSNYFVMLAGLLLLLTAVFMLKGLRTAWWFALILSIISIIGNLTKAVDYEEASLAFIVMIVLLFTYKQYYIKSNPRLVNFGVQSSVLTLLVVMFYGVLGFYYLDKKHFNIDFGIVDSVRYTFENFFLVGFTGLVPKDKFARDFLISINISGILSISFFVYTLVRPYLVKLQLSPEEKQRAFELLTKYGRSAVDYFKIYPDKMFYLPDEQEAFISYRVSGNYAVVLEDPIGIDETEMMRCIRKFDMFCYENGLQSIYFRIPESSLGMYEKLKKKSLFLGQEGIVNVNSFSLEGGSKKSLRNAVHKVEDKGYKSTVHYAPIKDGLLQKLHQVSDEWLKIMDRKEIVFSQGKFDWKELKNQTIITVENPEEKIVAFLNIIPDYVPGEATYDLIRKTQDAPKGVMEFILIELIKHLKSQNINSLNLGFAPMSGIDDAQTFPERSMKFAYERIRSFSNYKGLREFKEKFDPEWNNKYLIYEHDYDLLQIPVVLTKVIKP